MTNATPSESAATPAADWHARLGRAGRSERVEGAEGNAALARFRGLEPLIDQPPLDENVLAIHLGGAKRVTRWDGRSRQVFEVEQDSLTLMPANHAFRWHTQGSIDFAHVSFGRDTLARLIAEEFGRDPELVRFPPVVGVRHETIRAVFLALIEDLERSTEGSLYRESLLVVLACNLIRDFSSLATSGQTEPAADRPAKGGLAGWQLRRVIDYMRAHLSDEVEIADLVRLTGLSRAQFFRAFAHSTRRTPYAYLTDLRIESARVLLCTDMPVGSVAEALGLDIAQLSTAFRKRLGVSPSVWRREHRGESGRNDRRGDAHPSGSPA